MLTYYCLMMFYYCINTNFRQSFTGSVISCTNTYLMELATMAPGTPGLSEIQSAFRKLQPQLQNI